MTGPHKALDVVARYEIIDYVGAGGMQYVYAARDTMLDRTVALKTPKDGAAEKRFHRSAVVAAKVNHPNVAKTLDYFETNGRQYLVEEFIDGEDLDKALVRKIRYIDPYLAAKLFHHLAKAVSAAHHAGVMHRDLKPTNVMGTGGFDVTEIKITDFGIAKMAEDELVEAAEGSNGTLTTNATAVGALPYMSPEAIATPRTVERPTDIWSIGAMMYQLMTGVLPFGAGLIAVRNILDGNLPPFPTFLTSNPQFAPLASQLMDAVSGCLEKNPSARPTADALVTQFGDLCYPVSRRFTGTVREIRHGAWGFITVNGRDVFFHMDSVFGTRPSRGDPVVLSHYTGGVTPRAHPILMIQNPV